MRKQTPICMTTNAGNMLIHLTDENAYIYLDKTLKWFKTDHEEKKSLPVDETAWQRLSEKIQPRKATTPEIKAAKLALQKRTETLTLAMQGKLQVAKFNKRYAKFNQKKDAA